MEVENPIPRIIRFKEGAEDLISVDGGEFRRITEDTLRIIKQDCGKIGNGQLYLKKTRHGNGTFANRVYEEGEIVTYYAGKIRSKTFVDNKIIRYGANWRSHTKAIVASTTVIVGNQSEETGEFIVDPTTELVDKGLGAYINDPRIREGKPNSKAANTRFVMIDTSQNQDLFIQAEKKGAERLKNGGDVPDPILIIKALQTNIPLRSPPFQVDGRLVGVLALRRIEKDQQLFCSYGKDYWKY
jgi:hypothetical protein